MPNPLYSHSLACSLQLHLASLEKNNQNNDQVIHTLQKTTQRQEAQIQELSYQIATKEQQVQQTPTQLAELENMKMKALALEKTSQRAHAAATFAQEENSYYQKLATNLRTGLDQLTEVIMSCV